MIWEGVAGSVNFFYKIVCIICYCIFVLLCIVRFVNMLTCKKKNLTEIIRLIILLFHLFQKLKSGTEIILI